ncbi:unnamed protein product [Absidia cylindrospora]
MSPEQSILSKALYQHLQATIQLFQVALALEWTILTRFIVGVIVATCLSILYLVWTLRESQQPLVVWEKLNKPLITLFRPKLFAYLLSGVNPYAGSVDLRISTFSKGFCTGIMRDRHRNRNSYKSIHATALATLAETIGELALLSTLGTKDSAILISMTMDFKKKAKGLLTASSELTSFLGNDDEESIATKTVVVIKDRLLDTVAVAHFEWDVQRNEA